MIDQRKDRQEHRARERIPICIHVDIHAYRKSDVCKRKEKSNDVRMEKKKKPICEIIQFVGKIPVSCSDTYWKNP